MKTRGTRILLLGVAASCWLGALLPGHLSAADIYDKDWNRLGRGIPERSGKTGTYEYQDRNWNRTGRGDTSGPVWLQPRGKK